MTADHGTPMQFNPVPNVFRRLTARHGSGWHSFNLARLCFRGIYVPQMTRRAWFNLIFQNRRSIFTLLRNGVARYRETHKNQTEKAIAPAMN